MTNLKTIIFALSLIFLLNPFSLVFAYGLGDTVGNMDDTAGWAGYDITVEDPEPIIGQVIKTIISFLGVIFFILIVYGGFMWMTARGNADQIDKAKKIIMNSIVGLVLVLFAYAITWYIIFQLTDATSYDAG
jgi:hypothetical protein